MEYLLDYKSIFQWRKAIDANTNPYTINYPISFTSICTGVNIMDVNSGEATTETFISIYYSNWTKSSIQIYCSPHTIDGGLFTAIGY